MQVPGDLVQRESLRGLVPQLLTVVVPPVDQTCLQVRRGNRQSASAINTHINTTTTFVDTTTTHTDTTTTSVDTTATYINSTTTSVYA